MNLTKKVLAAAIAAVAFSGAANAAIVAPSSGNGDLIVVAWDTTAGTNVNKAYLFDTGISLNSILTSPASQTFNLSANFANWFGADLAAGLVQYTVFAADSSSIQQRVVSAGTTAPSYANGQTTLANINGWGNDAANGLNPAANGFGVAGTTNEWAWSSAFTPGAQLNPGLNLNGSALVGTQGGVTGATLNLYSAVAALNTQSGRTAILNPAVVNQLANLSVNLSNTGAFTYTNAAVSAVPLPAALWLLGSGLFGLIGVGRRRLAA
jgi:hypothetical protein